MPNTLGPAFKIGHYTDPGGRSGCTVILPPAGNVTSCDIRGSSPGSRELTLLDLDRKLTETHGVLLTGGSAFGLAAATGVVEWLEERGTGYATPIATIPIVPAAVVFDMGAGTPDARPGPAAGRAACEQAAETADAGRVGAGTAVTVGKWAGLEYRVPGGLGFGSAADGESRVWAIAVVNSVGDVIGEDGSVVAGTTAPEPEMFPALPKDQAALLDAEGAPANTVLAVVTTQATLTKQEVKWLAARGSDGITTSVRPAHTRYDGDVVFAIAAPQPDDARAARLDVLGALATRAVAEAVRSAVRPSA